MLQFASYSSLLFPFRSENAVFSFHFSLMGDILFLLRQLLTIMDNLTAIHSFPAEFRCRPCLVKYSLSKLISNIFTLLNGAITFFSCLLNLITSLLTHEGRRSHLGGEVNTTVFTTWLFVTKLHRCFSASLELSLPMSFDPP